MSSALRGTQPREAVEISRCQSTQPKLAKGTLCLSRPRRQNRIRPTTAKKAKHAGAEKRVVEGWRTGARTRRPGEAGARAGGGH